MYHTHRDPGDENDRGGKLKMDVVQGHPNLSKEINDAILNSAIAGGAYITDLKGKGYKVTTANTIYHILKDGDGWTIQGFPKNPVAPRLVAYLDAAPVKCNIHGSTWGGSMLKIGFIGRGMYLEFGCMNTNYNPPRPTTVTTSLIEDVEEIL